MARFILNTFFGSLVAFYMTLFFLLLFRPLIKKARYLYLLFLLPFFKITWDLFFSSHAHWVFTNGKEVLNQAPNTRILSAFIGHNGYPVTIKFYLLDGYVFSLGDICAEMMGKDLTVSIGLTLLFLTFLSFLRFGYRLRKGIKWKNSLFSESTFYENYGKIPVFSTARKLSSPLLIGVWKPAIICPNHLLKVLSRKELKAIVSHEKGHLEWQDNLMNGVMEGISALFWFIPLKKRALKKAYFYREHACDLKGSPLHIASALKKTYSINFPIGCIAFSSSVNRVKWTLEKKAPGKFIATISLFVFLGGALFIFCSHFLPF